MPGDGWWRRQWLRPLWAHAFLLGALLALVAPIVRLDEAFTIDEGAYGIQVRSLEQGSWAYQYQAAPADPEGRWISLYNPARGRRDWFAYVKEPTYPALQFAATRVLGDVLGLHVWGLLGALGAAIAAWLLAEEVQPGAGRAAFWVAASAPVFINAYVVWAHAPSAALAGFALVAALRLIRRPSIAGTVVLSACVAVGVLIRAEGVLVAVALAAGLAVGLRRHAAPWRFGLPVLCAVLGGAAVLADSALRRHIVGRPYGVAGFRDADASPFSGSGGLTSLRRWAGGRFEGAWNSLFQASLGERQAALVVTTALVLLLFAGWVIRRRRPRWERDATVAIAGAAVLYAAQAGSVTAQPMTGFFAAWPLALLGLIAVPAAALKKALVPAVVVVLFSLAVLATQYRIGGGREWGGRFFFPVLVPVAVLAALGLRSALASVGSMKKVVAPLAVALALLPTAAGVRVLHTSRSQVGAILGEVATGKPSLIMTHVSGLPPFAWKEYPRVGWMAVPPSQFARAAAALRAHGVTELLLLGPSTMKPSDVPSYRARDVTGPEARIRGWRTFLLRAP